MAAATLKDRVKRLEEAVAQLSSLSVLLQFQSKEEYETLLMIAANHNMRLSEYVRSCVIKYSNEFIAERDAQLAQAVAESEAVETAVATPPPETTTTEATSDA